MPEKPRDRETPSELIDPELIEGFSGQKALEAWASQRMHGTSRLDDLEALGTQRP